MTKKKNLISRQTCGGKVLHKYLKQHLPKVFKDLHPLITYFVDPLKHLPTRVFLGPLFLMRSCMYVSERSIVRFTMAGILSILSKNNKSYFNL